MYMNRNNVYKYQYDNDYFQIKLILYVTFYRIFKK